MPGIRMNLEVACRLTNEEGQVLTCISNFDHNFVVQELSEGEELFVNYASSSGFECTSMDMITNYGFVPEELYEAGYGPTGDDEDFDL
jgi:hypothetical protein